MEVGAGLSDFMRETGFGGCPLTLAFISQSAESDIHHTIEILNYYYMIHIPNTDKPPHVCALVWWMFSGD